MTISAFPGVRFDSIGALLFLERLGFQRLESLFQIFTGK